MADSGAESGRPDADVYIGEPTFEERREVLTEAHRALGDELDKLQALANANLGWHSVQAQNNLLTVSGQVVELAGIISTFVASHMEQAQKEQAQAMGGVGEQAVASTED